MPGMQLRSGLQVGGSYTPTTPGSASIPSQSSTISQKAYGVSATGTSITGPKTAGLGTTIVGTVAIAAMIFIWWSLPR